MTPDMLLAMEKVCNSQVAIHLAEEHRGAQIIVINALLCSSGEEAAARTTAARGCNNSALLDDVVQRQAQGYGK